MYEAQKENLKKAWLARKLVGKVKLSCKVCNKEFYRYQKNIKKYNACSKLCANRYKSSYISEIMKGRKVSEETKNKLKQYTGEKSSMWKGGISKSSTYRKKNCSDCNKLILITSSHCDKCKMKYRTKEHQNKLNKSISQGCKKSGVGLWMKGKKLSNETKKKISISHIKMMGDIIKDQWKNGKRKGPRIGKVNSPEHRLKISLKLLGTKKPPLSEEAKQKIREANIGRHHSTETKIKISNARVGKMPPHILKNGVFFNIKRGYYDINGKNIFFRSKWEANYALYLDFLKSKGEIKDWEFEPDVFMFEKIKLGTRSYRPDFKIFNNNGTIEYHEVKGWMDKRSKTKLNRMRIYYPEIKLILIDNDYYKDIKNKIGKLLKFY